MLIEYQLAVHAYGMCMLVYDIQNTENLPFPPHGSVSSLIRKKKTTTKIECRRLWCRAALRGVDWDNKQVVVVCVLGGG